MCVHAAADGATTTHGSTCLVFLVMSYHFNFYCFFLLSLLKVLKQQEIIAIFLNL